MPPIRFDGVGTNVSHNHMHDTPHNVITFTGNNHNIEYNRIHDAVQDTGDAGAIYTGKDWTFVRCWSISLFQQLKLRSYSIYLTFSREAM
jgi:hypothetical protein